MERRRASLGVRPRPGPRTVATPSPGRGANKTRGGGAPARQECLSTSRSASAGSGHLTKRSTGVVRVHLHRFRRLRDEKRGRVLIQSREIVWSRSRNAASSGFVVSASSGRRRRRRSRRRVSRCPGHSTRDAATNPRPLLFRPPAATRGGRVGPVRQFDMGRGPSGHPARAVGLVGPFMVEREAPVSVELVG